MADRATDEFWDGRPEITARQRDLLHAYYRARRDSREGKIPAKDLEESLLAVNYETDIAVSILQKLDDHYLKLVADKNKRKTGS